MKHKYTWLLLACLSGAAQAQLQHRAQWPVNEHAIPFNKAALPMKPGSEGSAKAAGDVVFSEDFANGVQGNNGVGAWTVSGVDGAIWRRSTTGPNGGYSNSTQKIASTTVANGFMIFDCDRSNSDTTTSPPTPLDQALFQSRDGYLISPQLDLSATPYLHLVFQQRARWCCSTFSVCFVDVSTDGGNTWPTRLQAARNDLFANDDPGTYTMSLDLHNGIVADPTQVKFRFGWEGSSASSGMSHYYWQIDDVKLVESENNDLTMLNPSFNAYNPDVDLTEKAEFDITPLSQAHELTMGSPVTNEGANVASNVSLHMTVDRDGSDVFDQSATQGSIAQGALDSTLFLGYTPDATGTYTLALDLSSDSTDTHPAGNTASKSWEVSDYVYAQDEGARDGVLQNTTAGNEYYACNFFWLENDATVYAIQVALANGGGNSQVGGEFDCTVLDGNLDELGTTDLYGITSTQQLSGNNQARFQTVMFEQPLELVGQQEVCACMHYYGGGVPRATAATSGKSLLGESLFMTSNTTGNRFIQLETPMVRMNFNPSVGIEESDRQNGVGVGQNFPNPSRGYTQIPYDLSANAEVTLEVRDLSGKLVASLSEGRKAPGVYRIELNTNELNEGVYFYTLTANGTRITKRMTVLH